MPIPPLRSNGLLPPGLYDAPLTEVFTFYPAISPERQTLNSALVHGMTVIWQNHLAQRIIIDGSYTTSKRNPNDIDMAVLTPGLYQIDGNQQFSAMGIDSMLLDIQFGHSIQDFDQWIDFFSRTRTGTLKGVVELQEGP
jgi:hypothetical protein